MINRKIIKKLMKEWTTEFELLDKKITIIITQDKGIRLRRGKIYIQEVDFYGETLIRSNTSVSNLKPKDFLIIITEKQNEKELEDTIKHELLHIKLWNQHLPEKEEHKIIRKTIKDTN